MTPHVLPTRTSAARRCTWSLVCAEWTRARRVHLYLVSILPYAQTELDDRVAADVVLDTDGTNVLAEGVGLDRFMVASRRHDLNLGQ
jgi:hypothetical protein